MKTNVNTAKLISPVPDAASRAKARAGRAAVPRLAPGDRRIDEQPYTDELLTIDCFRTGLRIDGGGRAGHVAET